ncbi:hypothetical protein [Butyrivibrio sp. WCD3002]|uniref:hypothetical protein n=1 Tax=Butyrivibrio sp. WCD3002 TaxID=1280676 RepID=UPI0003FCDB5C|nr:hypothetical protein [Butyrivibrio sp. WCD3002]
MKKKIGLLIKTAIFLCLLGICLFGCSLIVQRKSSYIKNEMYMQEAKKNNIDVFILGSSHVINGINPIQLYEDTGITAYNLGGYGSVLLSSYWQYRLALAYNTPKLVIVDAYMLENDIRYIDDPNANVNSEELHLNIDRFPLSRTKLAAMDDMFEHQEKKYPFLFDFMVYHDRWKELDSDDFKRVTGNAEINHLMGADLNYEVLSSGLAYTDFGAGTLENETVGTTYLRRIIEDCQSRGIDVVVVTVPFLAMYENQAAAHTAANIAAEYGVASINMLEMPGIVDYDVDFMDAGHMNIMGATKVTDFFGKWLSENKNLPDHRNEAGYENWQKFSEEFKAGILANSEENEDLYSQLVYLNLTARDKTFAISIKGGSKIYADTALLKLLKGIGATEQLDIATEGKQPYFMIYDHGNVSEVCGIAGASDFDTSNGHMQYEPASDLYRVLLIGDDTENNVLYSDAHPYVDLQLLFFDEGGISSHQYYTLDYLDYEYAQE